MRRPRGKTSDGLRAFEITDNSGYVLCFSRPIPPTPVLNSIAAHLYVSAPFLHYQARHGGPPFCGQVSRDRAHLALRAMDASFFTADQPQRATLLSASITVATAKEIERLWTTYQAQGVTFEQALEEQPWRAKNFVIKDPDANLILFAGPARETRGAAGLASRSSAGGAALERTPTA